MPWLWSSKKDDRPAEKPLEERVSQAIDSAAGTVTSTTESIRHGGSSKPPTTLVQAFTQPQTILAALTLTAVSLGAVRLYRLFFRRIPEAINIKPSYFQKRSVFGKVTSVGDGDNFRIYHTPGGWLAGWGWLPWRRVPTDKKELKNKTVCAAIRGLSRY